MKIDLPKTTYLLALSWALLACQQLALGVDLNIFSDEYDGFIEFRTDAGTWPVVHSSFDGSGGEGGFLTTGEWFTNGYTTSVMQFRLPNLGPVANPFDTAQLGVTLFETGGASTITNVDLYHLRNNASRDLLATDGFAGPTGTHTGGGVLIDDDFLTPASPVSGLPAPNVFTDPTGSTNLVNTLNAAYNGGVGIGDNVFLSLNFQDAALPNPQFDGYKIRSRNFASGGWPVLMTTTSVLVKGDVDGNLVVDLDDFDDLRANWLETNASFGSPLTIADGDLNLDGEVGLFDFREWKDVFNGTPLQVAEAFASLSAVPEPSSVALVLVAGLSLMTHSRKR